MKQIFVVRQEINDIGWITGDNFFTDIEDAVKHMRDAVAYRIRWMREDGYQISLLHHDVSRDSPSCIFDMITFRSYHEDYGYEYYDFRVFGMTLWEDIEEIRAHSVHKHYI